MTQRAMNLLVIAVQFALALAALILIHLAGNAVIHRLLRR